MLKMYVSNMMQQAFEECFNHGRYRVATDIYMHFMFHVVCYTIMNILLFDITSYQNFIKKIQPLEFQ